MHIIIENSGWLAIFFVWTMVWLPSKIDGQQKSYKSETGNGSNLLSFIFNAGMYLAGSLFAIFGFGLIQPLVFWSVVFAIGCLGIMTSSLVTDSRNKKVHSLGVRVYFIGTTIGGLGIMLTLGDNIGSIIILVRAIGVGYIYLKLKDTGLAETWGFSCATIWVSYLYLSQIAQSRLS